MKKNGLNVEHFRYHITINYDKVHQRALINQMLYQKKRKNLLPNATRSHESAYK